MIATVKIAPVERWCEVVRGSQDRSPLVELGQVEIDTASMSSTGMKCGGRNWRVTDEYVKKAAELLGIPSTGVWVCEHMLEMD